MVKLILSISSFFILPITSSKISSSSRRAFFRDGYILIDELLSENECDELRKEFFKLFQGDFDTHIYPDEWYPGRISSSNGITKDTPVREIVNAWKSSNLVAAIALSPRLGRSVCELMGWSGVRLAQDDCVWKLPDGGGPVAFHRDANYISNQFLPRDDNSVTIWIPLDYADQTNGVLEYALGSHRWCKNYFKNEHSVDDASFHGADANSYRNAALIEKKKSYSSQDKEDQIVFSSISIKAGSALIHHQDVLHGSPPNIHPTRHRRALVLHYIRHDLRFRTHPIPDYIYGRYVLHSDPQRLFDDFFPLVFSIDGKHLIPTSAASRRLQWRNQR